MLRHVHGVGCNELLAGGIVGSCCTCGYGHDVIRSDRCAHEPPRTNHWDSPCSTQGTSPRMAHATSNTGHARRSMQLEQVTPGMHWWIRSAVLNQVLPRPRNRLGCRAASERPSSRAAHATCAVFRAARAMQENRRRSRGHVQRRVGPHLDYPGAD